MKKTKLIVTLSFHGEVFRLPVETEEDSPFFRIKLKNRLEVSPVVLKIEEES